MKTSGYFALYLKSMNITISLKLGTTKSTIATVIAIQVPNIMLSTLQLLSQLILITTS